MYLCQHGVTLKYVSPIEIVIIGGAQFKHMLNIGTVPLLSTYHRSSYGPIVDVYRHVCSLIRHECHLAHQEPMAEREVEEQVGIRDRLV